MFLQLLPRSSTAERMNPYTSMWTGVHPGDGPQEFHLVLLDNGRTAVLGDPVGRPALHCIRCSACLNVCPVYERTGGHAYGSVYPGPIGAILTPAADRDTRTRRPERVAALCLLAVRRLLRRLPGTHRHSRHPGPPAGGSGRRRAQSRPGHGDARCGVGDAYTAAVRTRRETPRCGAVGRRFGSPDHVAALAGLAVDRQPRRTRAAGGNLPPVVGPHPRRAGAAMTGSRRVVLDRIRAALAAAPADPVQVPRDYDRAPAAGPGDADRFADAVCEYRAQVLRVDVADIAPTVAGLIRSGGRAVVPPDLPAAWVRDLDVTRDSVENPLPVHRTRASNPCSRVQALLRG